MISWKKKFALAAIILFFFLLPVLSADAQEKPIVPCGSGNSLSNACTLCHFIVGIKNIVDFGSKILVITAITAIFISGIMYIISSGSQEMTTRAKSFLTSSLIGFFIVLGAWLIVNTVFIVLAAKPDLDIGKTNWYTFTCDTQTSTGAGTTTPSTTPTKTPLAGTLSDAEARKKLSDAGISVNKSNCANKTTDSNCTSLDDMPAATVEKIINTKNVCGVAPRVTGGTEEAGHKSHGSGLPVVDFGWDQTLASCLKNNASSLGVTRICTTSQDSQYRIGCDYNETNRHIHVQY